MRTRLTRLTSRSWRSWRRVARRASMGSSSMRRIAITRLWGSAILLGLGGVRHGCLKEMFVVSARLDELFIQLCELICNQIRQ